MYNYVIMRKLIVDKKYNNNITELKDLDTLVDMSIRRTLYRTILTTLTTTIPVIILLVFGSKEIFNFNIALLVLILGTYQSFIPVYIAFCVFAFILLCENNEFNFKDNKDLKFEKPRTSVEEIAELYRKLL